MKYDNFQLKIELGNDGMRTLNDVINAILRYVVPSLQERIVEGPIMDVNGNKVGEFKFTKEYPS